MLHKPDEHPWQHPRPEIAQTFRLLIARRFLSTKGINLTELVEQQGEDAYYEFEASPIGRAINEAVRICFGELILSGSFDQFTDRDCPDQRQQKLITSCGVLIELCWPALSFEIESRTRAN